MKRNPKLKVDLPPRTKLSTTFANTHDCYKVVEEVVLGYFVSGGGRDTPAAIWPLYRADVFIKEGKTTLVVPSYDSGERLNGYTYHVDYEGCTFATLAMLAIRALEERRSLELAAKKKRGRGRKGLRR